MAEGTHPFSGGEMSRYANAIQRERKTGVFSDDHGKMVSRNMRKLVSEGNHWLQSGEIQRASHAKRKAEGRHHLVGAIPVINKNGNTKMMPKEAYYKQENDKTDWEWVATSSKIGKQRKK